MNKLNLNHSYQVINLIFAGFIVMVLIYSGIFRSTGENHPIQSQYKMITGENTNSTGMSRAFSEIVRFRFDEAKQFNENSLEVFAFFFLQLVLRMVFLVAYGRIKKRKLMIRADIGGSVVLFLLCFKDLMASMYT